MASAEIVVMILIILSVGLEVAYIPWYLIMLIIMWRTIRSATDGPDHVSIGMFGLLLMGLLRCAWMIWHMATTATEPPQLVAGVVLDTLRAIVTTYFMWHLQLKEIIREWLKD